MTIATSDAPPPAPRTIADSGERRVRLTLFVLFLVFTLNFVDRQIVNILAEPIKRDLHLSDTQLGLLTGLAFAAFYTVLGIPLARYADRRSTDRVTLISGSIAVWSAMTAVCGFAATYPQLLLARLGVGVGEAGCTPAAHSLIADLVPPQRRSSALALYGLGIPAGSLIGLALGGVLADRFGWRTAFLVVGAPGILMALLVWLTVPEPRRSAGMATGQRVQEPLRTTLAWLIRSRLFVELTTAAVFVAFLGYGKAVWTAVFFIRVHHLTPGQTGLWLGLVAGIAGMAGTWLGGRLAVRGELRGPFRALRAPAIGMAITAPFYIAAYAASDWRVAMAFIAIPNLLGALYYGPLFATVQTIVPPPMRAMAVAIIAFTQNLIGLGLGPLFFGMLSDLLTGSLGPEGLRWVLIGSGFLGLIPAWLFWRAEKGLAAAAATTNGAADGGLPQERT